MLRNLDWYRTLRGGYWIQHKDLGWKRYTETEYNEILEEHANYKRGDESDSTTWVFEKNTWTMDKFKGLFDVSK